MVDVGTFLDIAVSGVGLGALYALVAMGFSLIYKVTSVLNFAQGQLALVGAYGVIIAASPSLVKFGLPTVGALLAFETVAWLTVLALVAILAFVLAGVRYFDLPVWAAVLTLALVAFLMMNVALPALGALAVTILFGVLLGVLLERYVFQQFIGEPVLSVIIVTLALGGIFTGLLRFLVGPNFRGYPQALQPEFTVGLPLGASISAAFAVGILLSLVVVAVLMLFFRYTVTGSILRAAASDQQAAMVLGVSIERTIVVAWTLSIAITTIGGVLLAISTGGAGFTIEAVGIIIFAAVVFGGLDSVPGAFLGAIVVGLLQELGSFYVEPFAGPGFGQILPMIFLLVVIIVKPYGLFGTERIERL